MTESTALKKIPLTLLENIEKIFNQYDADGNGVIDSEEFIKFIGELRESLLLKQASGQVICQLWQIQDTDGDGVICIDEFKENFDLIIPIISECDKKLEKHIKSTFNDFDVHSSGFIHYPQFKLLLSLQCDKLQVKRCEEWQITYLFNKVDTDGDGKINLQDFLYNYNIIAHNLMKNEKTRKKRDSIAIPKRCSILIQSTLDNGDLNKVDGLQEVRNEVMKTNRKNDQNVNSSNKLDQYDRYQEELNDNNWINSKKLVPLTNLLNPVNTNCDIMEQKTSESTTQRRGILKTVSSTDNLLDTGNMEVIKDVEESDNDKNENSDLNIKKILKIQRKPSRELMLDIKQEQPSTSFQNSNRAKLSPSTPRIQVTSLKQPYNIQLNRCLLPKEKDKIFKGLVGVKSRNSISKVTESVMDSQDIVCKGIQDKANRSNTIDLAPKIENRNQFFNELVKIPVKVKHKNIHQKIDSGVENIEKDDHKASIEDDCEKDNDEKNIIEIINEYNQVCGKEGCIEGQVTAEQCMYFGNYNQKKMKKLLRDSFNLYDSCIQSIKNITEMLIGMDSYQDKKIGNKNPVEKKSNQLTQSLTTFVAKSIMGSYNWNTLSQALKKKLNNDILKQMSFEVNQKVDLPSKGDNIKTYANANALPSNFLNRMKTQFESHNTTPSKKLNNPVNQTAVQFDPCPYMNDNRRTLGISNSMRNKFQEGEISNPLYKNESLSPDKPRKEGSMSNSKSMLDLSKSLFTQNTLPTINNNVRSLSNKK